MITYYFRYKVVFPKRRKQWVAKPVMAAKSYLFMQHLMAKVLSFNPADEHEKVTRPNSIPKNIAHTTCPNKEDIIEAHRSRMGKKY